MREADVGSPSADTGRAISDHRISCPASYGDAAPNHQWEISEAVIGAADGTGISPEKDAAPIPMTIFQCEQMFSELPLKADTRRLRRHVRNVPQTEIHRRGCRPLCLPCGWPPYPRYFTKRDRA